MLGYQHTHAHPQSQANPHRRRRSADPSARPSFRFFSGSFSFPRFIRFLHDCTHIHTHTIIYRYVWCVWELEAGYLTTLGGGGDVGGGGGDGGGFNVSNPHIISLPLGAFFSSPSARAFFALFISLALKTFYERASRNEMGPGKIYTNITPRPECLPGDGDGRRASPFCISGPEWCAR